MVSLFSYGTLQLPAVQLANFGRVLEGTPDALPGYRLKTVRIAVAAVVGLSGSDEHLIVSPGEPEDSVPGVVLTITEAELAEADAYETDDYRRTEARLASGATAWVYVEA